MQASEVVWVVVETAVYFEEYGETPWFQDNTGKPLGAFTDPCKAEEFANQLTNELALNSRVNPFRYGDELAHFTSLGWEAFDDLFAMLGISFDGKWAHSCISEMNQAWWEKQSKRLTDEQLRILWNALDRVVIFKIIELPFA